MILYKCKYNISPVEFIYLYGERKVQRRIFEVGCNITLLYASPISQIITWRNGKPRNIKASRWTVRHSCIQACGCWSNGWVGHQSSSKKISGGRLNVAASREQISLREGLIWLTLAWYRMLHGVIDDALADDAAASTHEAQWRHQTGRVELRRHVGGGTLNVNREMGYNAKIRNFIHNCN